MSYEEWLVIGTFSAISGIIFLVAVMIWAYDRGAQAICKEHAWETLMVKRCCSKCHKVELERSK